MATLIKKKNLTGGVSFIGAEVQSIIVMTRSMEA